MKPFKAISILSIILLSYTCFAKETPKTTSSFANAIFTFQSPKLFSGHRAGLFPESGDAWQFKIDSKGNAYQVRVLNNKDKHFGHTGVVSFSENSKTQAFIMTSHATGGRNYTTYGLTTTQKKVGKMTCYQGTYYISGGDPREGTFGDAMGQYRLCVPSD